MVIKVVFFSSTSVCFLSYFCVKDEAEGHYYVEAFRYLVEDEHMNISLVTEKLANYVLSVLLPQGKEVLRNAICSLKRKGVY